MKKYIKIWPLISFFLLALCSSCDIIKIKEQEEGSDTASIKPLARVNTEFLYPEDIIGVAPKNSTETDSINIINRFVENWIRKRLVIDEASQKANLNNIEINRKVDDYRYALIAYEYEKLYVNKQLDKDVKEQEILNYYEENKGSFELKRNIVKCNFIKLSKELSNIDEFRKLISSNTEQDKEELRSYCFRFASTYLLEDTVWHDFDEVTEHSPFVYEINNKVKFLKTTKYAEVEDNEYFYFLKLYEYKISDELSPLEYVKEQIENIIINKRKLEITKKLKEDLYQEALKNENFEIFTEE